jgi:23S rRNA maturation-related 3'-5' exoribonuclease YhaM
MKKSILDEIIDSDTSGTLAKEDEFLFPLVDEINLIQSEEIRSFVRSVLLKCGIFWDIPSSFSEKYHPYDEHNLAGNVLHTKRVVRIAQILGESYSLAQEEFDIIIAAALLHDITKGIESESENDFQYDPMHPYTVNKFVHNCITYDKSYVNDSSSSTLFIGEESLQSILRLIRCHLGPWSPVPETMPITYMDYILHVADNIASKLHTIIEDSELINPKWKKDGQ